MRVIADLDCENLARLQTERAILVAPAQHLDFPKRRTWRFVSKIAGHPPRRRRLGPCRQQWIVGFHHLRPLAFAAIFPALFPL